MPSLNKTALILRTRKELIETGTTAGQWDDDELTQDLQDANDVVTAKAEMEVTATGVCVPGQEFVAYPTGIKKIVGLWFRAPGGTGGWTRLKQGNKSERVPDDGGSSRSAPAWWYVFGDKIFLSPIPDIAYDLQVMGHLAASDLISGNGSTLPLFDARFHLLLVKYAVARAKEKVDDPAYQNYDAQYAAGIVGMQAILDEERNPEGPKMPKIVSGMWD